MIDGDSTKSGRWESTCLNINKRTEYNLHEMDFRGKFGGGFLRGKLEYGELRKLRPRRYPLQTFSLHTQIYMYIYVVHPISLR
jgi:hypothetical protein